MQTISRGQFEQTLEEAPLLRKVATEINGRDTSILTHIRDLAAAADFARRQSFMPVISVVDWAGNTKMESWLKENPDLNVQPFTDESRFSGGKFCLSGHSWRGPFAHFLCHGVARLNGGVVGSMIDADLNSWLSGWWGRPGWPDHIARRMDEIYALYSAMADPTSKATFAGVVKSLQTGEPGYIPVSDYFHYFNPMTDFPEGGVVFEGGAAGGSYTFEVAKIIGGNGKIICFEPLQKFARQLKEKARSRPNITVEDFALSDGKGVCFLEANDELSRISEQPSPSLQICRTIDIDSYIEERGIACNAIKLDIEGSEMACLKGAYNAIASYHPLLVISIYHHAADNFDIPLCILDNFPGYELRMGHHSIWHHETVLYAKWRP